MTERKSRKRSGAKGKTASKQKTERLAVLDDTGVLVAEKMGTAGTGLPIGDLPANGTYKWDAAAESFVPLGFGFPKPSRAPVDRDYAVYLMMRAVLDGTPIPRECRDYCDWYETEMQRRTEEAIKR